MSGAVFVAGDGLLADFVCQALADECRIIRQSGLPGEVPEEAALALVLQDAWQPSVHLQAEKLFPAAGIPWLRGFVSFGDGVIGPLVRPGVEGCSQCADVRRVLAGNHRQENWSLLLTRHEQGGGARDAWASRTGLLQMAHLLAAEARRVLQGGKGLTEGHVQFLNLKTLRSSRHFLLPDALCPVCGKLPEDTAEGAKVTLQPSPKLGPNRYRCRSIADLKDALLHDYLDPRIGLMNGKMQDLVSPFAEVLVHLPLMYSHETTAGRTHSYAESERTAILEGLERQCGVSPHGKRTTVREPYRAISEHALNPLKVGVHAKEEHAKPDFPFPMFDPDRPLDWVWGYSLIDERPLLVPELLAYYSKYGEGFVFETSNGCALGGTLEEAIFYGILEVVERDSFLMTWYGQLPVPRLDPDSIDDLEYKLMLHRLREVAGYDLHLFNTTMENGIPSIWAIAKNRGPHGLNLMCAAGAHLDPVRAIKGALQEIAGLVVPYGEGMEANRETYRRMLRNPDLLTSMDDHAKLYGLKEAEPRLDFLLGGNRPMQAVGEAFKPWKKHADLRDDLYALLDAFRRLKLDVIVVDQTTPEILRNGLYCAKVLIPGMLSMTFGHRLTRLIGINRVLQVPMELGYAKRPLKRKELNPHPHPFP